MYFVLDTSTCSGKLFLVNYVYLSFEFVLLIYGCAFYFDETKVNFWVKSQWYSIMLVMFGLCTVLSYCLCSFICAFNISLLLDH